jgi:formyltetrahydrofolate hydrolase
MSTAPGREYVLTLSCPDKPGIVYAVSSFLVQRSANILASQQYGESPDGRFFMRVHFSVPPPGQPLAGATAHYVTPDLDEGPIIEQDVIRVDHTLPPERLAEAGRDVEAQVLARAVTWHAEHRVLLNGDRTVVFH